MRIYNWKPGFVFTMYHSIHALHFFIEIIYLLTLYFNYFLSSISTVSFIDGSTTFHNLFKVAYFICINRKY